MTPQELKASILQLAIQGKLVEQRPEEGSGGELLERIFAAKNVKYAKGAKKNSRAETPRRRGKADSLPLREEIPDSEKPFDIPESWVWVRVEDCMSNRTGLAYNKGNLDIHAKNMVRVLRGGNINDMSYSTKPDDVMISSEFVKEDLFLRRNMIITPAVTSLDHVGKMGRIERDYADMVVGGFVLMLIPHLNNDVFSKYLLYACSSKYFRDCCRGIVNKSGQAFYNLSRGKMMELILPLPPLAEQKRIVAKIEELLPYIDRYEKAWSKLEDFNKRFPVDMQKSLLQMAIQGKLVDQRPEEGTGEELYRQIQTEKQRLVKSGKIKKGKPLPEITPDEIPFDIPENWKWVRIKDIATKITDGTHHSPPNLEKGDFMYVTAKNIKDQGVLLSNISYVSSAVHEEIFARCNPELGDILLIKDGATTGVVTVNNLKEPFSLLSSVALLKMPKSISAWYLVYVLRSDLFYKAIRAQMKGTGITRVTLKQIENFVIPLPPLAEQKRIVAKLEELLPLCERLK